MYLNIYTVYRERERGKKREKKCVSYVRIRHVTQSCHDYVMSPIRTSRVMTMKESSHMYAGVMSHIRMSHVGWLQLVGSLKLYVSFAEYHLFYRALLQKRLIILRSLLIEATP